MTGMNPKQDNGECSVLRERFAFPVLDACFALGIKRTSLYELIKRKEIQALKIAGRTVIPRSEIERLTRIDGEAA